MSEKVEHTELPWRNDGDAISGKNELVTIVTGSTSSRVSEWAQDKANAAYIVLACNSYPALLAERDRLREALLVARHWMPGGGQESACCDESAKKDVQFVNAALKDTNQ